MLHSSIVEARQQPDLQTVLAGAKDLSRHLAEVCRNVKLYRYEVTPDGHLYMPHMEAFAGGWFTSRIWSPQMDLLKSGAHQSKNLLPTAGRNYLWDVGYHAGTQITTWYFAPFSANYTPAAGLTYATLTSSATEFTNYTETTRQAYVEGAPSSGAINNTGSEARITADTGGGTVYGFALVGGGSAPTTKGDTAGGGTLGAAARDANAPLTLAVGYKLDVGYTLSLTSS